MSPLSNSYLTGDQLRSMEPYYPLHALVCESCLLVQLEEYGSPEQIFSDYAYFSSYSDTWLKHAKQYAQMVTERFSLASGSKVIEIASNDGYLLRNFVEMRIPVLGIEPARNVAEVAEKAGVPTRVDFFGTALAGRLVSEGHAADLLIGNNVLAHVPALNDFVRGMKIALKPTGVITLEFPHLLRLMEGNQFDTIYHEHFSYFSFLTVEKVLAKHGLVLFDVEELSTHGGSLRIFGRHAQDDSKPISSRVDALRSSERNAGLDKLETYATFAEQVKETKRNLLSLLIEIKRSGSTIAGYGAPAKGNTLLNYCGIGRDFLDYTVDRNPHKQAHFLPGSHIPVLAPEKIRETRPDFVFVLPWNLAGEIMEQLAFIRDWGGRFIVPIPKPEVRS
jgi:2-polyprenyl-3-methyl-5-hydroxy-6-metoxy-1,4-benzoquinol methylase